MDTTEQLNSVGIVLKSYSQGTHKDYCPKCKDGRKAKNNHDTPLSVTIETDSAVWNCHNCGYKGSTRNDRKIFKYEPKPIVSELVQYFSSRRISASTLERFAITFTSGRIHFPYYEDGLVYNIKHRTLDKQFSQEKDATQIFYNVDALDYEEVIICEGEIDALSFYEADFPNVVSLPSGAGSLDACIKHSLKKLEKVKKFIIATDGDEKGIKARDELARRLNPIKCSYLEYPEGYKDANDLLKGFGRTGLQGVVKKAKPFPVEGIYSLESCITDEYLKNGIPYGLETDFNNINRQSNGAKLLMKTQCLSVWTGYPGSGKSEFLENVMVSMSKKHGWKFGIYSPEQPRQYLASRLLMKFTEQSWEVLRKNLLLPKLIEKFNESVVIVDRTDEEEPTPEWLEQKIKDCVFRHGINAFVIDPFNEIESAKKSHQSETEYISKFLTDIKQIAKGLDLHIAIVAHPRKPSYLSKGEDDEKEIPVPHLSEISGSATWWSKADYGVVVHREKGTTAVDIQKVKTMYHGNVGTAFFSFNKETSLFYEE